VPDRPKRLKPNSTTQKPKTQKPNSTTRKPNSTTQKPNSTTQKPNSRTQKPNSTTQKSNSTTQKPNSRTAPKQAWGLQTMPSYDELNVNSGTVNAGKYNKTLIRTYLKGAPLNSY
uniref:Uncharacterized protein n=1 Tax=Astyanax mexicanus TaxID=7994 RepID=A0A8B9JJH7_ASTMX